MLGAGFEPAREALLTQRGDRVRFSISDAFLPTAEELLALMTLGAKVEGTVINFSDSGRKADFFAVVDVVRRCTVVVPVEKLETLHGIHKELLE